MEQNNTGCLQIYLKEIYFEGDVNILPTLLEFKYGLLNDVLRNWHNSRFEISPMTTLRATVNGQVAI